MKYFKLLWPCGMVLIAATCGKVFGDFHPADKWVWPARDGKVGFADVDDDGWVDAFAGGRLYRNEAGRRFVEAEEAGVRVAPGAGGVWGDYDNDGRVDLFIYTNGGRLFRNLGGWRFERVALDTPKKTTSLAAAWVDLDLDGRLDLYVGGFEVWQEGVFDDQVYMNRKDAGFPAAWRSPEGKRYAARGVTAGDYDADGDTDIYVSNYRLQPNLLWRNDQGEGLVDVASGSGAAGREGKPTSYTGELKYKQRGHTIGSAMGDLDDDGYLDLLVANFSHPWGDQDPPQFLRNLGEAGGFRFKEMTEHAGLAWQESYASAALGDYDNDGDLDLFLTTVYAVGSKNIKNHPVLYRNEGGWRFTDVTEQEGLNGLGPTYQAAWADVDNDGDLDLCANGKLFINDGDRGHWVSILLEGDGRVVNRSAIGATVWLRLADEKTPGEGGRVLTRHVHTATGEGNQSDPRLHFGLGDYQGTVTIEVLWPGGVRRKVENLAADQTHRIRFESR